MLTPPIDLTETTLAATLDREWDVAVGSLTYRPVGFGSHHWQVVGSDGAQWFATVDELGASGSSNTDLEDAAFHRLQAALHTARDLHDAGRAFVVAPVLTGDGRPVVRTGDRFAVALYPLVDGESFTWGDFSTTSHRHGVLDLVIEVHRTPPAVCRHALIDDFVIPDREVLEPGPGPVGNAGACGPYGQRASTMIAANAARIQRALDRYDDLVTQALSQEGPMVLTHGEPHPGNTMLTTQGWVLIDWDTVLVALPERDLWSLDPGDGSVLDAYATATGLSPRPAMLDLFRRRWDLADLAVYVGRFRRPHAGDEDDEESWTNLRTLVARLPD